MQASASTWRQVLARLDNKWPDAGRLARAASLAVRVESRLLRRLRLRFLPHADASCESDLWFSSLVAVRDTSAFRWAGGAPEVLRSSLVDAGDLDASRIRAEIVDVHSSAPPLQRLEEELIWLTMSNAPREQIERTLGRVVRSLVDETAQAEDVAAWAVHTLSDLPRAARATTPAWHLRLAATSRFGIAPAMGVAPPRDLLSHVAPGVLLEQGSVELRIVRDAGRLWLDADPAGAGLTLGVLSVPATHPLWVEVSRLDDGPRAIVSIEPGKRVVLAAAVGDVLRNALGEAWRIEAAYQVERSGPHGRIGESDRPSAPLPAVSDVRGDGANSHSGAGSAPVPLQAERRRTAATHTWSQVGSLAAADRTTTKEPISVRGGSGWVRACAVTPNGQRLISSTPNASLRIWNIEADADAHIATLSGHTGDVSSCVVSFDGRLVISGSSDRTLKVWDLEAARELVTFRGHTAGVSACAVTRDSRRVVSASLDRTLRVWDVDNSETSCVLNGHNGWVSACTVTPDGSRIISAAHDLTLKIWDLNSGDLLATRKGHTRWVNACAVTADGRRVISASDDKTLFVWDVESHALLASMEGHEAWVNACAVTPGGAWLVSASDDKTLKIWDLATYECLFTHRGDEPLVSVAVGSTTIAAGDRAGGVSLLEWPRIRRGVRRISVNE